MVPGGSSDQGHRPGLWWQQEPWTLTQTPVVAGPLTQRWPSAASWASSSPLTQQRLLTSGCSSPPSSFTSFHSAQTLQLLPLQSRRHTLAHCSGAHPIHAACLHAGPLQGLTPCQSLAHFKEFSSIVSCLGCYSFGGFGLGVGVVTESFMSLFLNCASTVIEITTKVASFFL